MYDTISIRLESHYLETIKTALAEDIGTGDLTSDSIIPPEQMLSGKIVAKTAGVISGIDIARATFSLVDEKIKTTGLVADGDFVEIGTVVMKIAGPARSILKAERVALNFLQRMSGIATVTRKFVEAVNGSGATILDTRKTVPGLRHLDKWAVRAGGGRNHRFGLYDMALIKENHITAAGSIRAAVNKVRDYDLHDPPRPIEVEVTNLTEFEEALALNVDRIMLDNMGLDEMEAAVARAAGRVALEASGNVTFERLAEIAATGVDFISSGSLTHSVKALDLSLLLDRTN